MQMTKFGRDISVSDRNTALAAVVSGAFLALVGILVLVTGIVQAGNSSGAATIGSILFGVAATAAGGFLLRIGVPAVRRLRSAQPGTPVPSARVGDPE
jgi:hypothetical protein